MRRTATLTREQAVEVKRLLAEASLTRTGQRARVTYPTIADRCGLTVAQVKSIARGYTFRRV